MEPGEGEKRKLFESLETNKISNYSRFYQKWLEKEKIQEKINISRNLAVSGDKIKHRKPLWDISLLTFGKSNKEENIQQYFCETLEDKIDGRRVFLNEFVFVFERTQTRPMELVLSKFKHEVTNLLILINYSYLLRKISSNVYRTIIFNKIYDIIEQ